MTVMMIEDESALDLPIKGSVGSFKVASGDQFESLEVKYFLTHVGLSSTSASNQKLLKELAPVREIFDPKQLDFDEIMQRDIDDARVSNELIPYILDDKTKDLIKFFPPIVVLVLPISEDRNKPESYYPEVFSGPVTNKKNGIDEWMITRSGKKGSEVFEFEQPILSGNANNHDLVTLRLNTLKCRLVIVDGQHRAMSLIALYRNLKDQWSDSKRQPYKKYYGEWTPDFIQKFNLSDVNLPMIICTIPSLDTKYKGDYNLKKAARSIFLTLNKTARKVSRTRNILLDDNDLISSFMRKTLGQIKDSDQRTEGALRIQNIELDQDKQKLSSPIAISGVSHIYYIIEHLLLDSGDIVGVSARSGRFGARVSFSDAMDRLNSDELGKDVIDSTKRDSFTDEVEEKLKLVYQYIYGDILINTLSNFSPYNCHNLASLELWELLKQQDIDLESMLFAGQGVESVFEQHRTNLKNKLKNNFFDTDVPHIEAIVKELDNTKFRLKSRIDEFNFIRAKNYIKNCTDKNKFLNDAGEIDQVIISLINQIFSNVFSTVAFQTAIVCGFFNEYEKIQHSFYDEDKHTELVISFNIYLAQISTFFIPTSFSSFKKIVSLLIGHAEGDNVNNLKITEKSNDSFRGVVFHGEMQPDQWPKYRYLLMEIWNPIDDSLKNQIVNELLYCRAQVFKSLYERKKKDISQKKNVIEDDLTSDDLTLSFEQAFEDYTRFLQYFGRKNDLTKADLNNFIHTPEDEIEDDFVDE